jgi:hypothetical protein
VRGEGRILLEAWAIPDSPVFAFWPLASRVILPKLPGRDVLGAFQVKLFCENMGPFLGGIPPAVAPEVDLVFGKKAESPLTLFKRKFTYVQPTRASDMCKKTWKSFLGVEAM